MGQHTPKGRARAPATTPTRGTPYQLPTPTRDTTYQPPSPSVERRAPKGAFKAPALTPIGKNPYQPPPKECGGPRALAAAAPISAAGETIHTMWSGEDRTMQTRPGGALNSSTTNSSKSPEGAATRDAHRHCSSPCPSPSPSPSPSPDPSPSPHALVLVQNGVVMGSSDAQVLGLVLVHKSSSYS